MRMGLRSHEGGGLHSPSTLLRRVSTRVGSGGECCVLLSRIRVIGRFRSILGSCLRMRGTRICIANSGTQFLSGSIVARFHNQN